MVAVKVIQENGVDIHPETETKAIADFKQAVLDLVYPVGALFMSVNNVNPGTVIGGTWEKYAEGRTILGANTTYPLGSTGGEATHKLVETEMPQHNHSFSGSSGSTNISGYVGKVAYVDEGTYPVEQSGALQYEIVDDMYHREGSKYDLFKPGRVKINASHSHSVSGTIGNKGGGYSQQYATLYCHKHLEKNGIIFNIRGCVNGTPN